MRQNGRECRARFIYPHMKTTSAIVLAAGKGTRMRTSKPKVLHPICGRAMVGIVVDTVLQAGLSPVVVVVPTKDAGIHASLGDSVLYAEQIEPRGTGHAALQAQNHLVHEGAVVVLSGDIPLIDPQTLEMLVDAHSCRGATLTVLTSEITNPKGLGRIVRSDDGRIAAIVEERLANTATLEIREINSGVYCVNTAWLFKSLSKLKQSPTGEIFLTDLVSLATHQGSIVETVQTNDSNEVLGVNDLVELAKVQDILQRRIRENWMAVGVSMPDPNSVYISYSTKIGPDSIILPNCHLKGDTEIGERCEIGPNSIIEDSVIGEDCKIISSVLEGATLEDRVDIGPFSHLRPSAYLESEVHIGNYVEVKNSRLGKGSKSGHFSYIGDAKVGKNVNIGAGTITCNFDGENKHQTIIEDDVSIGSNTMLVAPVKIGTGSYTGASAVVNRDVPPYHGAVGMPAKVFLKIDDASQQKRK